jgi:hypothetical protein
LFSNTLYQLLPLVWETKFYNTIYVYFNFQVFTVETDDQTLNRF